MPSAALDYLADSIREAWSPPFRGQIYEYARCLNLQQGYAVKGPFDIDTIRHLREPLEAIRDPQVRLVSVQAAVQTGKSLIPDLVVPYWIEHDPGDILWLLENDQKAKEYAESRAMPLIRSVPNIHRMLQDVDRNDKTKTSIIFSNCRVTLAGLNESNVQTHSFRYVIIDEAWMARANGLIEHAILRTRQYQDTKKIILLGQGGWEDEDFDREHKKTDQRVLHWACPFCGFLQPFELSRLRGEDFEKVHLRGTYSGLSWETSEQTRPNGRWNLDAVGRTAHYRCHLCDARIDDRPELRRQLNESYTFKAANTSAPRDAVGFQWPAEASVRISFSDQVVKYLRAKIEAEELGYRLPLQIFYQKERGLTWNETIAAEHRIVVHEPYDVRSDWADEAHRPMIIDCQRDLAKFFYSVYAVALSGEIRELARGIAHSFDELAAFQKDWRVKDQQVFLDCGYEMTKVLRECVRRGHAGTMSIGSRKVKHWFCWTGLKGSGQEMFRHERPDPRKRGEKLVEYRIYSQMKYYSVTIGTALKGRSSRGPRAPWYEFSNLHCKDMLRARRDADPGVSKMLFLPDTLPSTDQWSHFAQMHSEKRTESFAGGRKRIIWLPIKESRPNHEWDKGQMLMAVMAILGIIGAEMELATETQSHGE